MGEEEAESAHVQFMFRRHCAVARYLERNPEVAWLLFLDADMGVVNPAHLVEEFLDPSADLVLYDRLFNFEVMAGSYLVRNSAFGRDFLRSWAAMESKVPTVFNGSDNGAIHVSAMAILTMSWSSLHCFLTRPLFATVSTTGFQKLLLDLFCASCAVREVRLCLRLWESSR